MAWPVPLWCAHESVGGVALGIGTVTVLWLRRTMHAVLPAAVVALVASCSLIQPSNKVLADQGESATASPGGASSLTPTPAATGQPAWVGALGAGVVVTAPAVAAPGYDSPGAAVEGEESAGTAAQACTYYPPSVQASCQARVAQVAGSLSPVTVQNFALGWVAVAGNEALVGSTGTSCDPNATPTCSSNDDPAAIFSQAKPFSVLWAESVAADLSTTNSYQLIPCVKVGGNWYLYPPLPGGSNSAATIPVNL